MKHATLDLFLCNGKTAGKKLPSPVSSAANRALYDERPPSAAATGPPGPGRGRGGVLCLLHVDNHLMYVAGDRVCCMWLINQGCSCRLRRTVAARGASI
eukprot:351960-Chlamydomonas_euryale.AAC.3